MPPIIDIKLDDTCCDGRKPIVIAKNEGYPELDNALKQQFMELLAPLGLKNPEGVYLLAHYIKHGRVLDDDELAQWVKPNDCDWNVLSLMEMLLSISGWKDVECVRVGYVLKSDGKTRSVSMNNKKLYEKLTKSVLATYLENYAPRYIVKEYVEKKYEWKDIIKHEVERLRELRAFSARRLNHRPLSNQKIYCMLLLFFDILEVKANKENSNIMIKLLQLMGLWKENQQVNADSYKLIIRQWHGAQKYKMFLRKMDCADMKLFDGIKELTFC